MVRIRLKPSFIETLAAFVVDFAFVVNFAILKRPELVSSISSSVDCSFSKLGRKLHL